STIALLSMRQLMLILASFTVALSIRCHQCNGWHGKYPDKTSISTCDNINNQCETPNFCVKIIDAMTPGSSYVTYKSDCYYAPNIQVNPQNLSQIQTKGCYPFQDGSAPVKRWWYCFCNDRD
ncbi:hypothetical protein PRIPAC_97083, partial [Pristionchus pacificus]